MDKNVHYLKWDSFAQTIKEKNLLVFSLVDLNRIFQSKHDTITKYIYRQKQKRKIQSIKKGLYFMADMMPDEFILANILYAPSYISLEFALSYYSIIPEAVYTITSVTAKSTRNFTVLGKSYTYSKIKKEAYSGYISEKKDNYSFFIATPEKALSDFLYFVSLGMKNTNDRINWSQVDKNKVKHILSSEFDLKDEEIRRLIK